MTRMALSVKNGRTARLRQQGKDISQVMQVGAVSGQQGKTIGRKKADIARLVAGAGLAGDDLAPEDDLVSVIEL